MSFASNLKALRQAKGLTQEQLAHACGWRGQSRVANYESTGKSGREPSEADIRALAAALEVTVAELFGEYPSAEDEYISRRHERSVRERDELRAYAGLPPLSHDLVEVPVFDLEVAAGGGAMNFDMPAKGSLMFQASSLRKRASAPRQAQLATCAAIQCCQDSATATPCSLIVQTPPFALGRSTSSGRATRPS